MKTYVVINRHIVQANKKLPPEERKPPIRMSHGKYGKPHYYFQLELARERGRLVYDPEHPMPCGATIWLELDG